MKKIIFFFLTVILFTSCLKFAEDDEIIPQEPFSDETKIDMVALTETYQYQIFYSIKNKDEVAKNLKSDWDLGFESSAQGWHIILNTSKYMHAGKSDAHSLNDVINSSQIQMRFDAATGNLDSTAIGDWRSNSPNVYIIDRGVDENGVITDFKKIIFENLEDNKYSFSYCDMDGANMQYYEIVKNPKKNFVAFSFDNDGEERNIEPNTNDWDMLFTQYSKLLFDGDEPFPMNVTGVLVNRNTFETAEIDNIAFEDIDAGSISEFHFFSYADVIGYDWKDLSGDVTSGNFTYVMRENLSYVLHNIVDDKYYKLRFKGFYNDSGEKGYPSFEYKQIIL